MLRVSIPYGLLSSDQLRMFARIAREYDKGFGHFTTRQNIQYNWPELAKVPDILELLASVEMHAIQTSGNCIRNVTSDHLAGVAKDEIEDPRPWCELVRQWATVQSAPISSARNAAVVSVVKYGLPVPAAKMTTRPFSMWRIARRCVCMTLA